MAQASPDPLPPGTLLGGRYRVERAIATTTTGAVYAAADTRDQHMVALKAIWPSYLDAVGDSILQRFVREAHVSAALPSSHIVPVLNGAVDPDTRIPYIVMPLLHGHDLGHWLEQVAPLPPVIAVRIAMQAAHGLRLAHDYGIVHRDIKPSNIFLDEQPEGRVVVRVSDFGVAKIKPVDEHHITRTGNLLGSPVYMSPEQLMRPQDVDPRADIWSLGMTLYHMLAGHAPLAAVKSFTDLVLMLSQEDIAPIQKAAPWIDPALARVVHGALIRSVSDRCPSIDAFFEALVPFADGSLDLRREQLVKLSPEERAHVAQRRPMPSLWDAPPMSEARPSLEPMPDTVPVGGMSLEGRLLGGQFRIGAIRHERPTATLHEATDAQGQPCLVKVYRSGIVSSPESLRPFGALLDKVMALKNDHLGRILGHGLDDVTQRYFVATELLRGVDLQQIIRTHGAVEPGAVARLSVQACQGLVALHGAGVFHQNLKPSNVFLHELSDGRMVVKLLDPGQACPLEHAEGDDGPAFSMAGEFALSPMYLSPEQVRGLPASHRSDLWSLALIAYEALSGRKPWQGFHSLGELLIAIERDEIRPLREVASWVEGGLADAVHGALHRDPARRYTSVRDLMVALGPFAAAVRALQRGSFASAKSSVVIRSTPDASGLDKTALADGPPGNLPARASSFPPPGRLPSTPPPVVPTTMVSDGSPLAPARSTAMIVAVVAGLAVVGVSALLLLRLARPRQRQLAAVLLVDADHGMRGRVTR